MTEREKLLLEQLIAVTNHYEAFREGHTKAKSEAIRRARIVIQHFQKEESNND